MPRRARTGTLAATVVALAALVTACSGSGAAQSPVGGGASLIPVPSVRQVHVSISDAGCSPQNLQVPAGPATFVVTNQGSPSVLEYEINQADHVIGEVENVVPGLDRTFTLNLKPGTYQLSCPGGTSSASGTLVVTE